MERQSLEQERAAAAWDRIRDVREHCSAKQAKEYGQLARGGAAIIQTNGLGQTLAFWRAKGCDRRGPKEGGLDAHYQILEHVSAWLRRRLSLGESEDVLKWIVEEATTHQYRQATAEAIAFLVWLKRFAEAELGEGNA